jgi:hypothetical protein
MNTQQPAAFAAIFEPHPNSEYAGHQAQLTPVTKAPSPAYANPRRSRYRSCVKLTTRWGGSTVRPGLGRPKRGGLTQLPRAIIQAGAPPSDGGVPLRAHQLCAES